MLKRKSTSFDLPLTVLYWAAVSLTLLLVLDNHVPVVLEILCHIVSNFSWPEAHPLTYSRPEAFYPE